MTTTDEQFANDNSGNQAENSIQNFESNSASITQTPEPEVNKNPAVTGASDAQFIDIPEKFKNKDGSANVASLVKSYKALEPLINEKADWTKEKQSLTSKLAQFEDAKQNKVSSLSALSVKLYEEALEKSSDPEKAKSLIEQFSQAPSAETIKELEALFPSDVLKENCFKSAAVAKACVQYMQQQQQQAEYEAVEGYLKDVVEKNFEALQNPVTANLFNEAFLQFGASFDADWFFKKMAELKDSFIMDYQKEQSLKNEKDSAISVAGKMSPSNSSTGGTPLLKRNALDLSHGELERMLDEYYGK